MLPEDKFRGFERESFKNTVAHEYEKLKGVL